MNLPPALQQPQRSRLDEKGRAKQKQKQKRKVKYKSDEKDDEWKGNQHGETHHEDGFELNAVISKVKLVSERQKK